MRIENNIFTKKNRKLCKNRGLEQFGNGLQFFFTETLLKETHTGTLTKYFNQCPLKRVTLCFQSMDAFNQTYDLFLLKSCQTSLEL